MNTVMMATQKGLSECKKVKVHQYLSGRKTHAQESLLDIPY